MYQKQQIIIDMSASEGKQFYEEQVKGYLDFIENDHYTYETEDEHFEGRVNFNVSEEEQDGKLIVTIDEDWTQMFRSASCVSDKFGDEFGYKKLLNAYLEACEETKKAVRFRYALRTVKDCVLECFRNNVVEIFDSANLTKPIVVRSDFIGYKPLPVKKVIPLDELPDKKWYTARTYIELMRCDGTCSTSETTDLDLLTIKELCDIEDAAISDEAVKIVEENEDFIKESGISEDSAAIGFPDTWDGKRNSIFYWIMDHPGELTTSELKQYVGKIEKLISNCLYVNEKCGFDISDPLNTIQCVSIMMYSDDFDAVEVTTDTLGRIVCRYYENGKTSVIDSDRVLENYSGFGYGRDIYYKTREIFDDLTEAEKQILEKKRKPHYIREYDLCSPRLAEMINGLTPTEDFDGTVTFDGDAIHIKVKSNVNNPTECLSNGLPKYLVDAYHNHPSVIDELTEMNKLCVCYSQELIEMISNIQSTDVPKGVTVTDKKVLIKDINEAIESVCVDKYPELRKSMVDHLVLPSKKRINAFTDCITWSESREIYVNDDGGIWGIKTEYTGRIVYTYYKYFLDNVQYGVRPDDKPLHTLWVGMKHECNEDEFCIDREIHKLGDIQMKRLREIHISSDCEQIATKAMCECKKLKRAYIYADNVRFPDDKVFADGVTIFAHKGSTAEEYAERFGYGFKMI